jgi:hypothetical protein
MANKPGARNWNDIQMVMAAISMAVTLAFWNMFAGPDRASAEQRAREQAAQPTMQPTQNTVIAPVPTPMDSGGVILLGGSAPQTTVIVHTGGGKGGGGGPVTSTRSS